MKDFYLYEGTTVLINKLGIKDQDELNKAEADYVSFRIKDATVNPIPGNYDYNHYLRMHAFFFQDLYEWAGQQRKLNIEKSEHILGGMSIEYSDVIDIKKHTSNALKTMKSILWSNLSLPEISEQFSDSLAALWKIHGFREGNTRTSVSFCCQFADENIRPINRVLFEKHSDYVRTALVAYNAFFSDGKDFSKKEYLQDIVLDAFGGKR